MKVLILNGPAESGKGTFLDILAKEFDLSIYKRSSIAWAKNVAEHYFGWDSVKTPESRKLLGDIKKLGIDFGDIPFKDVIRHALMSRGNGFDIFATDIREPDEIKKVVDRCKEASIDCLTIRIYNHEKENDAKQNLSEVDNVYQNYQYDFGIPNNGTIEEFRRAIKLTLNKSFKKEE